MNLNDMSTFLLKDYLPPWHFDPATVRQLKVLKFFGVSIDPVPTKGQAGSVVGRLLSNPANKQLWAAYVYGTGDEDDSTVELRPFDREQLSTLVVPEGWHPARRTAGDNGKQKALEKLVADLLKEGSPFDDSVPELAIAGKCFAFTGRFDFGSRSECQKAVLDQGGDCSDGVTSKTDVLVIGSDANPGWAHGSYGNKIEAAILRRMQRGKPVIVPEAFWRKLLES